jgi:polar amino acid transport system permease protein
MLIQLIFWFNAVPIMFKTITIWLPFMDAPLVAGRIIIPAAGNQYIMLLKSTSLASAVGYLELLRIATDIYSSNFRVVELLAVAAVWYLVMTAFATALQTTLKKLFPQR